MIILGTLQFFIAVEFSDVFFDYSTGKHRTSAREIENFNVKNLYSDHELQVVFVAGMTECWQPWQPLPLGCSPQIRMG